MTEKSLIAARIVSRKADEPLDAALIKKRLERALQLRETLFDVPLYFLRNYGVLLAVSVVCCTPLIEKLWKLLSRNAITKALTILVLLTVSMAYVVGSTNSPFLYFNF